MVHAALFGVPPVELFTVVQAGLAALKLSDNMVYGEAELDVADAFNATVVPAQIAVSETEAVTPVGTGLTEATTAVRAAEEQPVVVLRAVA
jgi:hypothetical protein